MLYLGLFFICGLLGWCLDTGYRSLEKRKYVARTLVPFFSIVFGLGGVLLFTVYSDLHLHPLAEILVGTMAVTILEFFSGVLSSRVLSKRLWDYRPNPYDLYGHIDVLHSFFWLIISAAFYFALTQLSLL